MLWGLLHKTQRPILAFKMPKYGRLKCFFFWVFQMHVFWRFKLQNCFMKLAKSKTPFLAFKRLILAFKTPVFSVYEMDPRTMFV